MGKPRQAPFDSFANPIQGFNLEGQETSKSWIGFIFTLGMFGVVIAVFISELVSMFARDSVTVSIAEQGVPIPLPMSLTAVTMAFGVMNRTSPLESLDHGVDFNIQATLMELTFYGSNPRKLNQTAKPIPLEICTEDYFAEMLAEVEYLVNINDIYCIPRSVSDELLTIQGQIGSDIYKFIQVTVNCGPNNSSTPCPASFVTSNIFFMYGASYLNVSNYANPISITATAILDRADRSAYHEKSIFITPREIITDHGVVFSDPQSSTDYVVSEGQSIIEGFNALTPSVFSFQIKLSPNKIVVNRTYKTILDVLASATGIASTIALVIGIILKPYVDLMTQNRIMRGYNEKYQEVSFRDFLRSFFFSKTAKQKMVRVKEDEEWIKQNMDIIHMLKNWSELQRIKKLVEPPSHVQDIDIRSVDIARGERASILDARSPDQRNESPGEKSRFLRSVDSKIVDVRSYSRGQTEYLRNTGDIELGSLSPQNQF